MSFDLDKTVKDAVAFSLNPFRAGRCLSTNKSVIGSPSIFVSIPFEQGDVFRRESEDDWIAFGSSQSLSSRAMSFDTVICRNIDKNPLSQSLSSRAMSFDMNTFDNWQNGLASQSLSSRAMSFDR